MESSGWIPLPILTNPSMFLKTDLPSICVIKISLLYTWMYSGLELSLIFERMSFSLSKLFPKSALDISPLNI